MTEFGWLKDFGVAGALLFVMSFFLWKAGKFLAPHVTNLTQGHLDMMDGLASQAERQTEQSERQTALMEGLSGITEHHGRKIDEIHRVIVPEDE